MSPNDKVMVKLNENQWVEREYLGVEGSWTQVLDPKTLEISWHYEGFVAQIIDLSNEEIKRKTS